MGTLFARGWGFVMALVGTLGVTFSVYAIIRIYDSAERMRSDFPAAIGQVERLVNSIHRRGETAVGVVQMTRDRFDSFRTMVEQLSRETKDRRFASVLNTLDIEILTNLQSVEEFVRSMQVSLHHAGSALLVLESIPFLGARLDPAPVRGESELKNLADGLADVSGALEQVSQILAEIRTRQTIDETQLARLQVALEQVDQQLTLIQEELVQFSAEVAHLAAQLSHIRQQSDRWIARLTGLGILFLFCFGFSQLHLALQGCHRVYGRS